MNTVKFTLAERMATEQHNLEVTRVTERDVLGRRLRLSLPVNLNVFVTNRCPCRCWFCINGDYSQTDIDDAAYYRSLEAALGLLDPATTEITITGGEPTLAKGRLVETLRTCHDMGFRFRTLSTTGLNLLEDHEGKPLCQHLIEQGATHNISISRMDGSGIGNAAVMRAKGITNDDIRRLATFFRINGADMRISCNLIRGHVDDMGKMLEFVRLYRELGVESVMFRELVGVPDGIRMGEAFRPDESFLPLRTLKGETYDVDTYRYGEFLVKHYREYPPIGNIVSSMSLRNGRLSIGFDSEIADLSGGTK